MKPMSLKAARTDAGYTQALAAKELNISKGTLANYESYITKPDIETAKSMARLYGRSVDEIKWNQ